MSIEKNQTASKKNKKQIGLSTQRMVGIAIFSALAFIIALICNPIPPVAGFLSFDVKDAIITVASFIYGPISAVIISFIAAFIEFITFSTTGWYGLVMNFVSSAVFSLTASLIYSKRRSFGGSLIAIYSAVVTTTSVMLLMNMLVTPWYLVYIGLPYEVARGTVADYLPKYLLPFNFAKTLLNSSIVMFLYKPLSIALSNVGLGAKSLGKFKWSKKTAIAASAAAVALIGSMGIMIYLWMQG